jgi:hypothetical protein
VRSAPLSPRIERLVLWKMAQGLAPVDAVRAEELSKVGQAVYSAVVQLSKAGKLPARPATLELAATESFGGDLMDVRPYLQRMVKTGEQLADADPADVLQSVRDQRLGQELTNRIWEQLRTGHLDTGDLIALLTAERRASSLVTAEALMKAGVPPEVSGPELVSLPRISRAAGGVHGRIVLGGLPNIGKTPLAWQISLEYSHYGKRPVLWYDLDDTGEQALLRRNYEIFGDAKKARKSVRSVFIRDSIMTLDADLNATPGALVVVDSVQVLPIGTNKDRRMSLDNWLQRMKQVSKRGHPVILISEVSRVNYKEARMSAFKETGAIEYAGTFGVQLTQEDFDDPTEVTVVKNRHREKKKGETIGHITNLVQHSKRKWWVKEAEVWDEDEREEEL